MTHGLVNNFELNYLEPNAAATLVPTEDFEKKLSLRVNFPSIDGNYSQLSSQKWAIHIHAYYIEELTQLFDWLSGKVQGAALYITTDTTLKQLSIEGLIRVHSISKDIAFHNVTVVSNSGRNIASLMLYLMAEVECYDLVLHLHTKRSTHNPSFGSSWLHDLLTCLASSKIHIEEIRNAFTTHPNLGIVIPRLSKSLRQFANWGQNYETANLICAQAFKDKHLSIYSPLIFPAGMMFWFRPKAMQGFRIAFDHSQPLPNEPLAIDGTCLHALERIVLHACEADGYDWAIAYPEEEYDREAQAEPHSISVWEPLYDDYLHATAELAATLRQAERELNDCKDYMSRRLRSPYKKLFELFIHLVERLSTPR